MAVAERPGPVTQGPHRCHPDAILAASLFSDRLEIGPGHPGGGHEADQDPIRRGHSVAGLEGDDRARGRSDRPGRPGGVRGVRDAAELEAELQIHRRASELLAERSDPKGASRRSK